MNEMTQTHKEEKNPGTGNTIIHISTAYNVNPNATEVNNTFIICSDAEGRRAIKEAMGTKAAGQPDNLVTPEKDIDTDAIHSEIMSYVSRVRPLLTDDAKSTFKKIWEDILDLPEVANEVYKVGKQWGTNFNRDLVANILYHLRTRKIYKDVYHDNINGAALAYALEGNKEHSVKHALRNEPPKDIRDAIDAMLAKNY